MPKTTITVAPTGAWPTKEHNPNIPLTPREIAEDVYEYGDQAGRVGARMRPATSSRAASSRRGPSAARSPVRDTPNPKRGHAPISFGRTAANGRSAPPSSERRNPLTLRISLSRL
ncbi:MAG: 3-keto-5-aminohexanoate cleavage protein [Roseiarcus sp.]